MVDKPISEFAEVIDFTNVKLAGYDPTRSVGDRNVKVAAGFLGNAIVQSDESVICPVDGEVTVPLLTPAISPTDVLLISLEISSRSIASGSYDFYIYAGDTYIYNWMEEMEDPVVDFRFRLPEQVHIPFAFNESNEISLRMVNQGSSEIEFAFQAIGLILPATGIYPPSYVAPAVYSGSLLADVYVGPDLVHYPTVGWTGFAEPRYAMAAIADGGTMHIAPGIYFLPFGIANDSASDQANTGLITHEFMGPNPSLDYSPGTHANHGCCRFSVGINIIGSGSYGATPTIFDGRGGFGAGFRLTFGKGFFYDRVGCNIEGIQFINCGGADLVGDGEAGIYSESFDPAYAGLRATNVYKCAFDGNENGIFTGVHGDTGVNTYVELSYCDFSYVQPNGQSGDGFSHDIYISCQGLTIDNCNFYGCDPGNCVKSRSPSTNVTNCFINTLDGRWIDYPDGGTLTVSDCVLQNGALCNTNSLGYATESDDNGIVNPVFTDCQLNLSRYAQVFWINDPTAIFSFVTCSQTWYSDGRAPASIFATRNNETYDASCVIGLTLISPDPPLPLIPSFPSSASYP